MKNPNIPQIAILSFMIGMLMTAIIVCVNADDENKAEKDFCSNYSYTPAKNVPVNCMKYFTN